MKATDDLFKLIKSLSMSEKRYFKLSAPFHKGEMNYIELFDAIDRQKEYNEEKLRRLFEKRKFGERFSYEKNRLYHLILNSLESYSSEHHDVIKINKLINFILILIDKGFPSQCKKLIKKAKIIAVKNDDLKKILELIELEKSLIVLYDFEPVPKSIINSQEDTVYRKLKRLREYEDLSDQYHKLIMNSTRIKDVRKTVRKLMNNELLKKENKTDPFKAKSQFYHIHVLHYIFLHDFTKALTYSQKQLDLFEKYPNQKQLQVLQYTSFLNNHIYSLMQLKKHREAEQYLEYLKKINTGSNAAKAKIFFRYYMLTLGIIEQCGEYQRIGEIAKKVEKELINYKPIIRQWEELQFYHSIACLYLYNCEYVNSIHWLNKILNYTEKGIRMDFLIVARIMNLIAHYELKNYDMLEYTVKSTYRYLDGKKQLNEYEKDIIDFIETLIKTEGKSKEYKNLLINFKIHLTEILKRPNEKDALQYFDIISWLESKIEKKKFTDVLRAKLKS